MNRVKPEQRIGRYEEKILAPYAMASAKTRGRVYPQAEHRIRTPFQRDRDRVIHSAAFRRLEYKTQVFVNHEGDHYRTRLTHTIEVAQISRTIARALGLNEDLAEAIALVHDLGHTPFGHSGEEVLNRLLADHGGFNHNHQSLRVVDYLERRYPEYPGLNLTYEVREGIAKHEIAVKPIRPDIFPPDQRPTLEASLVDLADAIAYNSHDVDDGLSSHLLDRMELETVPLWVDLRRRSEKLYPRLDAKHRRYSIVRMLVDRQVVDLVEQTEKNLHRNKIATCDDVRHCRHDLVSFSTPMSEMVAELKRFLLEKLYRHEHMREMAGQAEVVLETLFDRYLKKPELLHGKFKLRLGDEPVECIIRDFIAGMTDRYAYKMYERLA